MALVDIDVGVISLSELVDLIQGGDISIHTKDSVCDNDSHSSLLGSLKLFFKVRHVHVSVASSFSLAQPDAIDYGGVVESIADDGVFWSKDGFKKAGVGVESAGEEDRVFKVIVVGDGLFELLMDVLGAADEPDRAHSEPMRIESVLGSLYESWMIG